MKIKLSKIMAAVTAIGVTFAGFTALAATDVTVFTHTDYVYDENGANDTNKLTVKSTVSGVTPNTEVTYYVSTSDAAVKEKVGNEGIIYIDQKTATDGTATFEFSGVEQGNLYHSATTAKYGSNGELTTTTFSFNEGCNYVSKADNDVTIDPTTWINKSYVGEDGMKAYSFTGKVVGNPSQYGVKVKLDGVETKLPALGCGEDGTFVVVIQAAEGRFNDISANLDAAEVYVEE